MAATNSYLSSHYSNHHHHSSPAHLDTPRSFTSPQAPYPHEQFSSSHRHTAPLNKSYPQHVGGYRDDRRYSESRTSGNQDYRAADLRSRHVEQRPRNEPEQTGNYKQTVDYDHAQRRPSGEELHHMEFRPSTAGEQRHAKRRATDYTQGNRHQTTGSESYHSTPEVGSGGYDSMDGCGLQSWEQPQSMPPNHSKSPASTQLGEQPRSLPPTQGSHPPSGGNLDRPPRTERSPLLGRGVPPSTHSSLPSTAFQSYPQSSGPPSFQSHSQSNIPLSSTSYQPYSRSNVSPSSLPYHSQSNVPPSSLSSTSPSTSSSSSSAAPTYQLPHSRSGGPPSSSAHSSSLPHENLHNRVNAISAQTRSYSDNSLPIPGVGGRAPKGAFKSTRSEMDLPTPNMAPSPLVHSSEPWSSSHCPVHPDSQTTGGSSSSQRPFDSGSPSSPRHLPAHTAGTKSAPHTSMGSPGSSRPPGMSPTFSELPVAGASQKKKFSHGKRCLSKATLENERYSLDGISRPDHDNEDRDFFREEPDYTVFGVFDGHDGARASGFASSYMRSLFDMPFWSSIMNKATDEIMREALGEFFRDTESQFFKSIQTHIDEKNRLQRIIPQHLSSYAAYQQFPYEVSCLQDLEPKLTGGCTAVLAILIKDKLFVANAGDSRAVLVREQSNGTLAVEQLTQDHSVESEEELRRLEALGLDPRELIKAGRLGMHENTRSIGDYSIKQGYKEVDILRSAKSAPGIATPYIMPTKTIDHTCKYLILMTDGVYKSIESTFEQKESIDANKVLLSMLDHHIKLRGGVFDVNTADEVLARVAKTHRDCFTNNSRIDPRSDLAVGCRKRDDMTLLVYKFPDSD